VPANFSRDFYFFNHVRALRAPLLIMIDHGWCSDIPLFFLRGGLEKTAYENKVEVLDVAIQPRELWQARARDFQMDHRLDGYVVYYFETASSHSGACGTQPKPFFRWPTDNGCLAVFRSQDLPGDLPIGQVRKT
jgi:hypothetical protein